MPHKRLFQVRAERAEIRRLLVLGLSNEEIMQQLKMAYSTFMRALQAIMLEDEDKMLSQQQHGLALAINITKKRFLKSALNLSMIAKDKEVDIHDRLEAEQAAVAVYQLILKLEGEQAIIASNINRNIITVESQLKHIEQRQHRPIIQNIEPESISNQSEQQQQQPERPDNNTNDGSYTEQAATTGSQSQRVFS